MSVTKAELEAKLAELEKQQEQAIGQLNALGGAKQMLTQLIADLDAKATDAAPSE